MHGTKFLREMDAIIGRIPRGTNHTWPVLSEKIIVTDVKRAMVRQHGDGGTF